MTRLVSGYSSWRRRTTTWSAASACSGVAPGARRAIGRTQCARRKNTAVTFSGSHPQGDHRSMPGVGKEKPSGATPAISTVVVPTVRVVPTTLGSAPKCDTQNAWLRTTTSSFPSHVSSHVKARPRWGGTPSTEKKFPETLVTVRSSASPSRTCETRLVKSEYVATSSKAST